MNQNTILLPILTVKSRTMLVFVFSMAMSVSGSPLGMSSRKSGKIDVYNIHFIN